MNKLIDKPSWMTNLVDFFDPHNIEHIRAYKHLMETGKWPLDFAIEASGHPTTQLWQVEIVNKMANAWVEMKLSNVASEVIENEPA